MQISSDQMPFIWQATSAKHQDSYAYVLGAAF